MNGRQIKPGWIIAGTCWIGLTVALMFVLRNNILESFTSSDADKWQVWRDHVKQEQEGTSPVLRRVPSSELPPAFVLMQDHFAVCLTASVVFSFLLFATFSFLLSGVLSSSTVIQYEDEDADTGRAEYVLPDESRGKQERK